MINNKKLIEAIISNDLEKIKSLISKDNINYQNNEGNTALHFATKYRNLDALSFLIANKANINIQNNEGNTVLMNIVNNIHLLDTVKYLIAHGAKINIENKDGNTVLDLAAMYDVFYVVKHLLEKKANINFKNNALFLYAARIGDLEIIKAFLANGIDINTQDKDGNTTLHFATKNRRLKTVTFLLTHGININQQNKDGNTALHIAVNNEHLETVTFLLAHGININQQNKDGNTALHIAVNNEHLETVTFLLAHGININQQNKDGNTALHLATNYWNLNIVNVLIANSANINQQNKKNETAFMNIQKNINKDLFAPTHFCSEIDSILTTFPQFLNQQNKFGDSPLMTQIRYKNIAMINCLLTKDVNLNLQNEDNDTAFSLSLIFLPNKTALHQQFFNPEIAKITLNQQATKEIATFFIGKDGTNYKYIFTVKKEENDEYTFSKPVITKSKAITAKIFVVDFAINNNNGIQKNSLFELQSLDDSGLDGEEAHHHTLYLKQVFKQLLPNSNFYYPGDHKRKTIFLNANHNDNKIVVFKQCHSDINHKALQLFIAHVKCNLKNDGSTYPISKIYCSQTNDEKIANILQTIKNGNIEQGVLKAFREYQGNGNTFVDFRNEQLNKRHLKDNKILFQENISCLSQENGKYNSFRGLVIFLKMIIINNIIMLSSSQKPALVTVTLIISKVMIIKNFFIVIQNIQHKIKNISVSYQK